VISHFLGKCEKQESNLRTPARTDLESASVDHLDILAWNNVGLGIVKGFEMQWVIRPEAGEECIGNYPEFRKKVQ
jgi:hypothetical protein